MRAASLQILINNFDVLLETWELAMDAVRDSETRACLTGISTIMKSFDCLSGVLLGVRVLRHTDHLNKTLQSPSLSATDAHACAKLTVSTLHHRMVFEMMTVSIRSGPLCSSTSLTWMCCHLSYQESAELLQGSLKVPSLSITPQQRQLTAKSSLL